MAQPGALGQIVIGAAVVVFVLVGLIWLAKRGYFEPDTNEESLDERDELVDHNEEFRIPYRRRVSSWSLPYKVFAGSLVLLMVGFAVATYQVMKTGSPYHQFLTAEVRYAIVAVIAIGGGVRLKGWFDDQVGELLVTYERAGAENLIERIPYAKTRVRRREGVVAVPEIAETRLLGLFWRYRQVGEDRRLRGRDKPLDDVITHQIPDHGDQLPDASGYHVVTRKDGDHILDGATSTADVTYGSPHSLSDEQAAEYREKIRRKEADRRAVQATNAELYSRIRKLEKKIENEEHLDRAALLSDFREISEMISTLNLNLNDRTKSSDDAGRADNGEEARAS